MNTDAACAHWQDASQLVADGDAAFNIMGDWADGYFSGDTAGGNWAWSRVRAMAGRRLRARRACSCS